MFCASLLVLALVPVAVFVLFLLMAIVVVLPPAPFATVSLFGIHFSYSFHDAHDNYPLSFAECDALINAFGWAKPAPVAMNQLTLGVHG